MKRGKSFWRVKFSCERPLSRSCLLGQIKDVYSEHQVFQYAVYQTSSPMGNDHSPEIKHNDWRHHNLGCSKAGNSELEKELKNDVIYGSTIISLHIVYFSTCNGR